jgi:hypothetical protein
MSKFAHVATGLGALVLAGACVADTSTESEPQKLEWGLGAKADELCDSRADLCWGTADLRAVQAIDQLAIDVAVGARPAPAALEESIVWAEALAHKLDDDELVQLGAITDRAFAGELDDALAGQLLAELRDEALLRVRGSYLAAASVPTGRAAEAVAEGKFDELEATDEAGLGTDDGYSEGIRESLQMLRDLGLGGRAVAMALELTGSLDVEYEVVDRETLAALDGPSRRARIDRASRRYALGAGALGTGTGLISMIPIAGIPLSVPISAAGTTAINSRMTLDIASLNGWDINEGANLYIVTMFQLTDDVLADVTDEMAIAPTLPSVIRRVGNDLGIPVTTTLAVRFSGTVLTYSSRFVLRRVGDALAREAAERATWAAAEQVLGWASLGLTALAAGAIDAWVTDRLARHVEVVSRPWLVDLPVEGLSYLDDPQSRRCYGQSLAAVLRANGSLSERELRYFTTFLLKPYYDDDGERWFEISNAERLELLRLLAADAPADTSCLRNFRREHAVDKLTILSHLYAAAHLGGEPSDQALAIYAEAVDTLNGTGWFSGPHLPEYEINFVQRAVELALDPSQASWPLAYREAIAELSVEDMLPYLSEVSPELLADAECIAHGDC